MIGTIIALVVLIILRITIGYLATVFEFLKAVVPWITGLIIGIAAVMIVLIIIRIVKEVRK